MERQALPLIPVPFRLVVRQVRTEEGYVTDPLATRQLGVLRGLLENAEGVVIATDAGREGELVSRYLPVSYTHLDVYKRQIQTVAFVHEILYQ